MARSFVIRPFNEKYDTKGRKIDFEHVHNELIEPARKAAGLEGSTTGEVIEPGNIREDMFALILEADVAICDVTIHNANVFYELGIRHALRKRRTVLLRGKQTADATPFDILTDRYVEYDLDDPAASVDELTKVLRAALTSDRETDSPIFKLLPGLTESDISNLVVVPPDFGADVRRAIASESKGWLGLLGDEVRGLRFEWQALKLIADAQWSLRDYKASQKNWEAVLDVHRDDIDANLALANIFERLSRDENTPELLEQSDMAIKRVLDHVGLKGEHRAEALALRARNRKTRWRLEFENLKTLDERREAAMNRALVGSYTDYQEASMEDLNHYWSALAAAQMGTILHSLSDLDAFRAAFDSDREADRFKEDLDEDLPRIRATAAAGVARDLGRRPRDDKNRFWAEISRADLLFLNEAEREDRVLRAYQGAVPKDNPFAWDSAKGQLELFASVGFRADLVKRIIGDIDPGIIPKETSKPVHLVVMAGHRIDKDRTTARFPPAKEAQAKALLREAIESQSEDGEYTVIALASAAPGTDILCHEICAEANIDSRICLPMPASAYAKSVFADMDDWRTRFLNLTEADRKIYELGGREGLPRWHKPDSSDPWERGNRWVIEMAKSWDAKRVSLIALWDGKGEGDAPGGTAQLVQLARDAGTIRVNIIDTASL